MNKLLLVAVGAVALLCAPGAHAAAATRTLTYEYATPTDGFFAYSRVLGCEAGDPGTAPPVIVGHVCIELKGDESSFTVDIIDDVLSKSVCAFFELEPGPEQDGRASTFRGHADGTLQYYHPELQVGPYTTQGARLPDVCTGHGYGTHGKIIVTFTLGAAFTPSDVGPNTAGIPYALNLARTVAGALPPPPATSASVKAPAKTPVLPALKTPTKASTRTSTAKAPPMTGRTMPKVTMRAGRGSQPR